jgi:uncharacterized protein (DUF1330 family)
MSAYIVIHNEVTDPATMQKYLPTAVDTLAACGAEILVVTDDSTVLEGHPPFPRTIILKFASREAAKLWYESAKYREVLPLRLKATKGYAILVNGLDMAESSG